MENLDAQQFEVLFYIVIGLIGLIVVALILYLVFAARRAQARLTRPSPIDDLVIRPEQRVVGQILSLVRTAPGASLQVEIGGRQYRNLTEVQDADTKRQIVAAAMELIQFTGVLSQEALSLAPLEKTETWREDLREDSDAELERARGVVTAEESRPPASPEVEQEFLDMLAEIQPPADLEKPSMAGAVKHAMAPKPLEQPEPRTFVDEIEEIVQRRLQLVPALAGRGLHVRAGSAGKVFFAFEGRQYESIEEIPNTTARKLVQDAIKEWDETA